MRQKKTIDSGFQEKRVGGNQGLAMGRRPSQGVHHRRRIVVDPRQVDFCHICSLRSVSLQTHPTKSICDRLSPTTEIVFAQTHHVFRQHPGFSDFLGYDWLAQNQSRKLISPGKVT